MDFVREDSDLDAVVKVKFFEKKDYPRTFIVAKVQGTRVAALSVHKGHRKCADIEGAYTLPRYRQHGMFQRLLNTVMDELRRAGYRTVTIQANDHWIVCPPPSAAAAATTRSIATPAPPSVRS